MADKRTERALDYAWKNYAQPALTLSLISRQVGVSRQRLGALLRRDTGLPFRTLLKRIRVAEAERLLLEGDLLVKQVAAQVGYASTAGLDRDFRKVHGHPPTRHGVAAD